jgi:peptidoglycan/LPS O-acetylase OafA/YrhL
MSQGHVLPEHLVDPGKEARAKAGLPVVPAFDGYRAFAILAVVLLHMTTISGVAAVGNHTVFARLIWGTLGHAVEILFVVSGFVVFLPTVARGGKFGSALSFAIRRGARLLPAYWMILLVSLVVIGVFHPAVSDFPGPRDAFLNFTGSMVPVGLFISGVPLGFGLNQPLWTLSVEVCFYIALPFIAAAWFRRPLLGLAIALLVTVGWSIAFDHVARVTDLLGVAADFNELVRIKFSSALQLPAWAYSFGLGMTGAWAWVRLTRAREDGGPAASVAGRASTIALLSLVALLVLVWVMGGDYDQTRESLPLSLLLSTMLATLMVALSLAPSRWQVPVATPLVRRLGDISYGIYLSHMLIAMTLASELSLPQDGDLKSLAVWIAAVVPAAILYGYLSARFLEQPIRRWARKYGRRDEG